MRFYKVKIILISSVLVVGFLGTPVNADNANPPKILDLIQVTQGPYKPGDLVTYKVVFTGGNPGLKRGEILFDHSSLYQVFGEDIPGSDRNGLVSFPLPVIDPGTYGPIKVTIKDKTDLREVKDFPQVPVAPLSFIVSDYIFKQIKIGEVTPSNLPTHTLDLQMIPKNPKVGDLFELPKYSSVNVPIEYSIKKESSSTCKIIREYEYPIFPGGQLQFLNNGLCMVSIRSYYLGKRPSYSQLKIISLATSEVSLANTTLSFQVVIEKSSSSKTITCIKGKLIKKVTGTSPKCPTGYKKT